MRVMVLGTSLLAALVFLVAGCNRDAKIVSHNISNDADHFKIYRRVVFFNGITDKILLTITGRCSIYKDVRERQLEVTCKVGPNEYKKHYLGISDNVTYFAEQLNKAKESSYHYVVRLKLQSLVPSIKLKWDSNDESEINTEK